MASTWPVEVFGVKVSLVDQAGAVVCGGIDHGGFSLTWRRMRTLRWHPKTWHVHRVFIQGGKHFSKISPCSLFWSELKAFLQSLIAVSCNECRDCVFSGDERALSLVVGITVDTVSLTLLSKFGVQVSQPLSSWVTAFFNRS